MKKIFIAVLSAFTLTGCVDMDFSPADAMSKEQVGNSAEGALYVTTGNYALYKEPNVEGSDGSTFIRQFFQTTEFRSDNIAINAATTDKFYDNMTLSNLPTNPPTQDLWQILYRQIVSASGVIDAIADDATPELKNLKGENLFMRAYGHWVLINMFAKPYHMGRDNPGVRLVTSGAVPKTIEKSTVGQVYDQIVTDLIKAAEFMTIEKGPQMASKAAALGLLSRVYLFMEEFDKAITAADDCIAVKPLSNLESKANLPNLFAGALTSNEVLFAVACTTEEDRKGSSIASMYIKSTPKTGAAYPALGQGDGWGEIFASQPLMNLLMKNPTDRRLEFIRPDFKDAENLGKSLPEAALPTSEGAKAIFNEFRVDGTDFKFMNSIVTEVSLKSGSWKDADNGVVTPLTNDADGYTHKIGARKGYLLPVIKVQDPAIRPYPCYFTTKFSYQAPTGSATSSSPILLRLAEVVLNRAEAKIRKTAPDVTGATSDVKIIRDRAGISTPATVTLTDVLNERRMELFLEGHRHWDLVRNKMEINREYPGVHPYEKIAGDSERNFCYIPAAETVVSGMQSNR